MISRHTEEPFDILIGRIKKKYAEAFPTVDYAQEQWRINKGANGARAPGLRAPEGPAQMRNARKETAQIIINLELQYFQHILSSHYCLTISLFE